MSKSIYTKEQLEYIVKRFKELQPDCGDNSCRFASKENRGGMRTNGGCRCYDDLKNKYFFTFCAQILKDAINLSKDN